MGANNCSKPGGWFSGICSGRIQVLNCCGGSSLSRRARQYFQCSTLRRPLVYSRRSRQASTRRRLHLWPMAQHMQPAQVQTVERCRSDYRDTGYSYGNFQVQDTSSWIDQRLLGYCPIVTATLGAYRLSFFPALLVRTCHQGTADQARGNFKALLFVAWGRRVYSPENELSTAKSVYLRWVS